MSNPESVESLPERPTPGDIIALTSITELAAFEDLVADGISPFRDNSAWAARVPLSELIRPKIKGHQFNGQITDISLEVMDEPYERLLDAPARGIDFKGKDRGKGGVQNRLTTDLTRQNIPLYKGFVLQANARSSGRGIVGKISTELWYAPISLTVALAGTKYHGNGKTYIREEDRVIELLKDNCGRVIKRWVATPKFNPDAFVALNETSRGIGLTLLRQAMLHPISTPMQD